jgi:hypothetical protein
MVNIGGNEAIVNAITPFLGHFARGAANKMASMLGAACAKSVIQGAINFYYSEKPPHYWNLLFFEIFNSLDYMGY